MLTVMELKFLKIMRKKNKRGGQFKKRPLGPRLQ